ncbi:MAG TPA: isoleucine--tRNA ligase [Spirochaetota bacterium]|nr:isoleucine--tRNA ligase [Spirochaetota bacterium]HOD14689.1 isoleucine--tRNA ligase [Spirochaetota bacterium]HPN11185.1 isoleucine--tRNA ligase [Spirochaetota bacterium]HQL80732.1 isoleucine--tRNA ligase [Spirochaetota bacterium]
MDYSKTVNLPTTDFPMKANLPQREPEMLKLWEKEEIYDKIQESRAGQKLYILHDGPPYANGHLHMGHALNKILKDIIVKHKTMMGFKAPYVPGWDCHGLPIEHNVTRELGVKAETMPKEKIRDLCRVFADKFVKIQMEEFKRLGVFGDYKNPYKTMTPDYEATIVEVFGKILEKGYIYRSKKPIYWCPTCVTALAEAEVEYANHASPAIFVKFKVDPATMKVPGVDSNNTYVVIWTTTPWTLPANLAVSFHPEFQYSAVKFGNEYYIVAKGLIMQIESAVGRDKDGEIEIPMEDVRKLKVYHPFIDRESKVIFGTHVTLDAGTGIVHTAPGHGHEDYIVGLEYGLDVYCPVDEYGRFTDDYKEMKGINVFDANDRIVDLLKEKNVLIKSEIIEHSYPHCWRCKKPLIYRATEQWFLSIDHNDLRKKGIENVAKTEWIPAWGQSRFLGMVESRPDWCLSRQRSWGVPIPSFRCEACGTNMMSAESVKLFADISRKKGIDSWFTDPIKDLIPAGTTCTCGNDTFVKEFDILDVWFDSGVSHFAVLDTWKDHRWPADLYLEGSDQHRGWFQSSFWPAMVLRGRAPYNTVLTHGFMLDEDGKAMSKSLGNVKPPEDIIKEYGADIVRLWVSSEEYRNDVRIGMNMLKQIADSYRRIRNTFKFIIGNLSDFSEKDAVAYENLSDLDQWLLHKLYTLSERIIEHYEKFEFHLVYRKILNFCAVELSSIYFDISKDLLYVELPDSKKRRAIQTVLSELLNSLARLAAPVLAFTMEEIWQFIGRKGSVHMDRYYQLDKKYENPAIEEKIERLVDIKKDVLKELEICRREKKIKSSLETDITLFVSDENARKLMAAMGEDLSRFFQVAAVTLASSKTDGMADYEKSSVSVKKTGGKKCVRCWNYFETIGTDPAHPELCKRCTDVITAKK